MAPFSAAVIGLGRVGLPFATFLASKGVIVKGVETDLHRAEMIRHGRISTNEPNLPELFVACRDRLEITDLANAITSTELAFLVVPTPARSDGSLSDDFLRQVVDQIAAIANANSRHQIIVVVSTVSPGTLHNYLNANSIIRGYARICYSPVFVALGSVLENLTNPPFLLIGADEPETLQALTSFYLRVGYRNHSVVRTSIINAEIAKLALNVFLATKISFANSVAEICDEIPEATANTVLEIIARDARVGAGFLQAGTPFGGPCLPRDNAAFLNLAEKSGVKPILLNAVNTSNEHWYHSLVDKISKRMPVGAVIAVVGLTYKPRTDYAEDGFGLRLARDLAQRGYKIIAHDPGFRDPFRTAITNIEFNDDLEDALRQSFACVLTWPDVQLARQVAKFSESSRLIDIWGYTNNIERVDRQFSLEMEIDDSAYLKKVRK